MKKTYIVGVLCAALRYVELTIWCPLLLLSYVVSVTFPDCT